MEEEDHEQGMWAASKTRKDKETDFHLQHSEKN